jgi:hypothetical protein
VRDVTRILLLTVLAAGSAFQRPAFGAADSHTNDKFLGEQSCRSSGCHGGGEGKNQTYIFEKKDVHTKALATLSAERSKRMGEALGIPDVSKDARCTVCHSPLQAVPESRWAGDGPKEAGLTCETCHGPAGEWIRFHTRKDITRDQRLAAGMREMKDLYDRVNTCVACHLYVSPEFAKNGHPEMSLDLARQQKIEPPHWKDAPDDWAAPREWLTSQAADLRELGWRLSSASDERLQARMNGLLWVLRQTTQGKAQLPEVGADARSVQSAADKLAHSASHKDWDKVSAVGQLKQLTQASEGFREKGVSAQDQRARAEWIVQGIGTLWRALQINGAVSPTFDPALLVVQNYTKPGSDFDGATFAGSLQQLEVAMEQMTMLTPGAPGTFTAPIRPPAPGTPVAPGAAPAPGAPAASQLGVPN